MIVTEDLLAPYRDERGILPIELLRLKHSSDWRPVREDKYLVPDGFFTDTVEAFRAEWPDLKAPQQIKKRKEALEVSLVLAFTQWIPKIKPDREWLGLEHQCGGHSCNQVRMIATRLKLRPELHLALRAIAREGYYAETGHFDSGQMLASRLAWYFESLKRLHLDCEATWRHLAESLYPIDATQDNLNRLAKDAPNLETLVHWGRCGPCRYSSDPVIFLMTQNSD